jgi:phosphonate transport system substrate-binding protein
VATTNSVDLKRFRARTPEKGNAVRVIWTSPPIPSDPIVWRVDLPADLKARIREFLLGYGHPAPGKTPEQVATEATVLGTMARTGFRESDNRQLIVIRQIELYHQRVSILADRSLDQEERRQRLDAIEARLHRLQAR